jgi:hypothetical protein
MKKTISILLYIISLLIIQNSYCQESKYNYSKIVYRLEGDLNNDNLKDLVIVKEDSSSKYNPYLLEIKFKSIKNEYETVLTSEKAVMEKHPEGDKRTITSLENLEITKGVLIFTNQFIRGSSKHKFRYQNGNFELIGYTSNDTNPGYFEFIDYNLSTGQKISIKNAWETNKVLENINSIEKIHPLPKLQDFSPIYFVY